MGKHFPFSRQRKVELDEHQPGCFLGMLHVLDYHKWQYVKKLLHYKKRHPRIRCYGTPKTVSLVHDAPEHIHGEAEHLLGQHHTEEGKDLGAKDISGYEIDKKPAVGFNVRKLRFDLPVVSEVSHPNPRSTKVEDELVQRILQNPHFGILKDFTGDHDCIRQPRFTKARSFPLPDSSGARHYRASSLKHKQSEVWFFSVGNGLKVGESDFPNGHQKSLVPSDATPKQGTTGSSLENRWWNHMIMGQFKGIKRRIKRALRENSKGRLPAEVAVGHGNSCEDVKESSNALTEESKLRKMTRLSSLNESLDKYARLFEDSFGEESKASSKLDNSKSLKLTAEDKSSEPKTFRRRLSLPDQETLSSLLCDLSFGNLHSGLSARTKPESNNSNEELKLENHVLDDITEADSLERSVEGSDATLITEGSSLVGSGIEHQFADGDICNDKSVELTSREGIISRGEEIAISPNSTIEAEPSNKPEATCISEGVDLRTCGTLNDERVHARNEAADNIFKASREMVKEEECAYNFVEDILRLGGFFENEFLEPWESMDLPLNPKIFDEMESSDLHGLECFQGYCKHQVLFDLINEALIDICEKHFTYFPNEFSLSRFMRPVKNGQDLLEEIWHKVKLHLDIGPELHPTLDDIVSRDMWKGDQWMNLKLENECVGLELEDMILDQLIAELVHS